MKSDPEVKSRILGFLVVIIRTNRTLIYIKLPRLHQWYYTTDQVMHGIGMIMAFKNTG